MLARAAHDVGVELDARGLQVGIDGVVAVAVLQDDREPVRAELADEAVRQISGQEQVLVRLVPDFRLVRADPVRFGFRLEIGGALVGLVILRRR